MTCSSRYRSSSISGSTAVQTFGPTAACVAPSTWRAESRRLQMQHAPKSISLKRSLNIKGIAACGHGRDVRESSRLHLPLRDRRCANDRRSRSVHFSIIVRWLGTELWTGQSLWKLCTEFFVKVFIRSVLAVRSAGYVSTMFLPGTVIRWSRTFVEKPQHDSGLLE